MESKAKRVLIIIFSVVIILSLSFLYCLGGFFIPTLNTAPKDTFELIVSEIPEKINVGDEITVTARLKNHSLRFFHIGHSSRKPIKIAVLKKGEIFSYTTPLTSRPMLPLGSFTEELSYIFEEGGEYVVIVKTEIYLGNREPIDNDYAYDYSFDDVYIVIE